MPNDYVASGTGNSPEPTVPGISGKRLTVWLLLALAAMGILISYTLWSYGRLDAHREETAVAWRAVTEELVPRYALAEGLVANEVARGEIPGEKGEQLRLAVDRFQTTSLTVEQEAAAREVETLLATVVDKPLLEQLAPDTSLQAAVEAYNASLARQSATIRSLGGRILSIFLYFPSVTPFSISSPGSSSS
jgi:hypothetical protein